MYCSTAFQNPVGLQTAFPLPTEFSVFWVTSVRLAVRLASGDKVFPDLHLVSYSL